MSSGIVIGGIIAVIMMVSWMLVVLSRRRSGASGDVSSAVRQVLTDFAGQSLLLSTTDENLVFAAQAAQVIFGTNRVVVFERGDEEGTWEARLPREKELGNVASQFLGVFGWLAHNSGIAVLGDLAEARFGAMRRPLGNLMKQYDCDVLMPLVERGRLMAVIAVSLGRKPSNSD